MKRPHREINGKYNINGKLFNELVGSRKQVWGGYAYKTAGGLNIDKLVFNPSTRRIISRVKHISSKKDQRLIKKGFYNKKGIFGTKKNYKGGNKINTNPSALDYKGNVISEPSNIILGRKTRKNH